MISFYQLNEAQRLELKQNILANRIEGASWGELAEAADLVSDEDLEAEFSGYSFSPEDFS